MILAFHSIISTYGFWLPNEPRGSWSTCVRSWELAQFGPATKVDTRRSVARKPYDRRLKQAMLEALQYEPVSFTGEQAKIVALSFANTPYTIHACAVLPEHAHLVIAHTSRNIRRVVGHLKAEATRSLHDAGFFDGRSPWAHHGWNVYLNSHTDVRRAIEYVENNPIREGKKRQRWSFEVPYDPASSRRPEDRR